MTEERISFSKISNFSPKQLEALQAVKEAKYVLYGGAMGGGKSYWLRWICIYWLLYIHGKYNAKGVRVGLFCEDYPALKDRHLSKIEMEFPAWLGTYRSSDHDFVLKPEYGGGVISFRNLDDASKYQSAEFAMAAVDELTRNPYEVFMFLRTRLRWPGVPETRFVAGTNPGGPGHAWVKKMWIDHIFESNEVEKDQFRYVRALASDNPFIDKSYLVSLEGLPEDKRRAFLEGDWDIFSGQYFTEWRKELHVVEPHAIPPYARPFIGLDYGYTAPSAVLWGYKDHDDFIYIYRELYVKGRTYEQLAHEISSLTPKHERVEYWACDPAIWARKGETEMSGADIIAEAYHKKTGITPQLVKGMNSRVIGWNEVRAVLRPQLYQGKQIPRLRVFKTCDNLIRTLPSLIHDKHNPEDIDSDGEDHASDALRYMIASNPPKNGNPSKVSIMLRREPQNIVRKFDLE
jgi:phage terminase large subunit